MMQLGMSIGYGSPHTLTDTAVLDKVYKGVLAKQEALPGPIKALFGWGLQSGAARFESGQIGAGGAYNLLYKKVQALIGGRIKLMITGSAPLSPDIQRFVQTVFNCPA